MDRRGFLKELGLVGGSGVLLAMFPWLQSCSDEARREVAGEKARLPRRSAPVPNAIPISTNCSKIRMYRAS